MKQAVVILNFNDSERVYNLTTTLLGYKLFDYIVISDNNSNDEKLSLIQSITDPTVVVLYNKDNLGFSGGNNVALEWLKDKDIDYVYTINSDVYAKKELFIKSVEFMEEHKDIAISSFLMNEYGRTIPNYYAFPTITHFCLEILLLLKVFRIKTKPREKYDDYYIVDSIRSSYWCLRYNQFDKVGFFDLNTFLYHIETCVCIKLNRAGYKCAVLTTDTYDHNHIYKPGYRERGYRESYKSLKYIFTTYYHKNKFQMVILAICYHLGMFIRKVLRIR